MNGPDLRLILFLTSFLSCGMPGHSIVAAPGDLDTSFGSGGKVTTVIGPSGDTAKSVAIQSDGKIVVAGYSATPTGSAFAVVRYSSNGTLDKTFNNTGKVVTPISQTEDLGTTVLIQPDGKIVVAGTSNSGNDSSVALVRYTSMGVLDPTFHGSGTVTTRIGSPTRVGAHATLQGDGKILVVGCADHGDNRDFAILRYRTDGSLDLTFHETGIVTAATGSSSRLGFGIAVQQDGRVIVVGSADNGAHDDFALLRFKADGSPDRSFNRTGRVTTHIAPSKDFGYNDSYATRVAVQKDGKIIVSGHFSNGISTSMALLRYNSDGTLDTTFNGSGRAEMDPSSRTTGRSLALQSDGKIVVAGSSFSVINAASANFAVLRFADNGRRDPSFHEMEQSPADAYTLGFGIAIQRDGKIVVAGSSDTGSNPQFAVARYEGGP